MCFEMVPDSLEKPTESGNAARYPGAAATPELLVELANQYRIAAMCTAHMGKPRNPLSRAPTRWLAIHAMELYLNTFLLTRGIDPIEIRKLQHDLAARAEMAKASGLVLRKKAFQSLLTISQTREYLVTRYSAEMTVNLTEINRLMATLDQLAQITIDEVNKIRKEPL